IKPVETVCANDQIERLSPQLRICRHCLSRLKTQCLKLFSRKQLAHDIPMVGVETVINDSMVTSRPCSNSIIGFQAVARRQTRIFGRPTPTTAPPFPSRPQKRSLRGFGGPGEGTWS